MYVPSGEALAKLPMLQEQAAKLEKLIDEAKNAKKQLASIRKEVQAILKGPVKKRGPRKPKAVPEPAKAPVADQESSGTEETTAPVNA